MRVMLQHSEDFRLFLDARLAAQAEDEEVAYRMSFLRFDAEDTKHKNYIDVVMAQKAAQLSFTTEEQVAKFRARNGPFDLWNPGGWRVVSRAGGLARELTGIDDGRKLEVFTGALTAHFSGGDDIRVLTGTDIIKYYIHRWYCSCIGLGDLATSCMRYDNYEKRFEIYRDNAKMAAVFCSGCGKIRGRALLWETPGGEKFIDRRYGPSSVQTKLLRWAGNEGYENIWGGRLGRSPGSSRVIVPVAPATYEQAAYLDSLPYWCRTCNTLSNHDCGKQDHDIAILQGVQGTNHVGWWGRCPSCHSIYDDRHRQCHNQRRCDGCGARYCGTSCPNDCWYCSGCRTTYPKGRTCKRGCVECPHCSAFSSVGHLRITHGLCSACNGVVRDGEEPPNLVFHERTRLGSREWWANCPDCGYGMRSTTASAFRARSVLVSCQNVHGGPGYGDVDVGHCPSCYTTLRVLAQATEEQETT